MSITLYNKEALARRADYHDRAVGSAPTASAKTGFTCKMLDMI